MAYAGSKLDVKPLLTITVDGKLSLAGVARGRKKGIKQLAEYYQKRVAESVPGQCVVVAGADCPKDVGRLKEALAKVDDSILFLESSIGPVIGSHVGPAVGIAYECASALAGKLTAPVQARLCTS